jgi:hypothetical protein
MHDVGIIIQKYSKMVGKLASLANSLNITEPVSCNHEFILNKDIIEETSKEIISHFSSEELRDFINCLKNKGEHGFAAAAYLVKHCYKDVLKYNKNNKAKGAFILTAAEAVAIHNSLARDEFPSIDFQKSPVAAMLIFCDAIQSWKRELIDGSIIDGDSISKVELCELESINKWEEVGPQISLKIRYYLHSLGYHKPTIDKTALNLQKICKRLINPIIKLLSSD